METSVEVKNDGKHRYKKKSSKVIPDNEKPRRKRGVTETPDMDVVIGYNLYPDGIKGGVPHIVINVEPLPDPETIKRDGLPGFETVNECKRVILRPVPGNDFFYELIKTNLTNERIFLICEPTDGSKMTNLSGRHFNILFIGREGKEVMNIRPCPNTKETVSINYKQHELGRIVRHSAGDSLSATTPSHTVLDRDLNPIFLLRKKVQVISRKKGCFSKSNHKVDNGYNIFVSKKSSNATEVEEVSIASIVASNTELKFNCSDQNEEPLGLVDKVLLFATLVSIKTKAMESAGIGLRLSLAF